MTETERCKWDAETGSMCQTCRNGAWSDPGMRACGRVHRPKSKNHTAIITNRGFA